MSGRVVVLGGGVAGLTAADELSRRGYRVELLDAGDRLGGRARTVVPPSFPGSPRNVLDSLADLGTEVRVEPSVTLASGTSRRTLRWDDLATARLGQLDVAVDHLLNGGASHAAFGGGDVAYLAHLLGVVVLADRHKLLDLESHGFADYTCRVFAERSVLQPSGRLRSFLAGAATRVLGLACPHAVSARTGLVGLLRLLQPMQLYVERGERVLAEPAQGWLDRWAADLATPSEHRPVPVSIQLGRRVTSIEWRADRVVAVTDADGRTETGFDHLVSALPHRALRAVLGPTVPPALAGLDRLRDGWVVGVRCELAAPVPGHESRTVHLDTPWALTSWPAEPGVVVVRIDDGDAARDLTADEIADEVARQLGIAPADIRCTSVDTSPAPTFVNAVGSWSHRPPADLGCPNLFVAGDFVRTNADVASFESANESARRAVQALLEADGYLGPRVKITNADHLGLLEE